MTRLYPLHPINIAAAPVANETIICAAPMPDVATVRGVPNDGSDLVTIGKPNDEEDETAKAKPKADGDVFTIRGGVVAEDAEFVLDADEEVIAACNRE